MKRKTMLIILSAVLAMAMVTACGPKKSEPADAQATEETKAEEPETEEPEAEELEVEEPETKTVDDIEYVESSIDAPAEIGQWVEGRVFSYDENSDNKIYYRITGIARGEEAQAAVDEYNAQSTLWILEEPDQEALEYCAFTYEIYYPKDFPADASGIVPTNLQFEVTNADDGTFVSNGVSYIGLRSVYDGSNFGEAAVQPGDTVTGGKAIFAMIKDYSDYVIANMSNDQYYSYVKCE